MRLIFLSIIFVFTCASSFAATRTWDGGGSDANWQTATNWAGDVAPSAGDDLVFPATAAQFSTNNNFFFLTSFNSITIEGGTYTLGGNTIKLAGGLNVLSGSQTINLSISLAAAQTFTAGQGATATLLIVSLGSFPVTLDGAGTVGIGLISGSGSVTKNGTGAGAIIASAGFSGAIAVNGGIFVVDANVPGSPVTVNSAATTTGILGLSGFGGTGTVGPTNVIQGAISAGTLTSPTGILNITGGLSLSANAAYVCKIGGTSPGASGHDQLNVTGAVNLNNARLGPLPWNAFRPAVGDSFVILRNDGTDPINGTFLNAPEGSVFSGPLNTAFRITYTGGDGNDISVTRVPRAAFDFDGDGKADIGGFSGGLWNISSSGGGASVSTQFGLATDQIAPADYDGDNKTDIAVYRPSNGVWYILNSLTSTITYAQFGLDGDQALPNDFDGDGRADIAVFRPSTGDWFELRSLTGQAFIQHFGAASDKPQAVDFDGDGMGDLAVFRPSNGSWYFFLSGDGSFVAFPWGIETDVPVPADYDGDGRTDAAVFRATADGSQPDFYILRSTGAGPQYGYWGLPGDVPAVADYDGDGRADLGVVRPGTGGSAPDAWYLLGTTSGYQFRNFVRSVVPLPAAYIR